ncbi:MAG: YciI family protein [Amnibacterium sp.]
MQYVMFVRVDPELAASEQDGDVEAWVEEGTRTGMRREGSPLEDPEAATLVRVRDGETLISDGPFAEFTEFIAGYDLLEADSLEQAADYASRHPVAAFGALEVRQVWADFVPDPEGGRPEPRPDGEDYLFLHVPEPALLATATRETGDPTAWVRDVEARRITLGGDRLRDEPDTSAVVRRRDGETVISHGPFAEVVEQIAGIDLVRVRDRQEALDLAAAHPTSHIGVIEVRALRQL